MKDWIRKVGRGERLEAGEAEAAFGAVMRGEASEVQIAALLVGLRVRGESPEELAGAVRAMREAMVEVPLPGDGLVDTCGTGGGTLTTFNISTVAGIVAAAAGARVAKHGNRSFTSRCGSADLLEELEVEIELSPDGVTGLFDEVGFTFMFAPGFHPAMRHVASVRRTLGIPTIMNLLGPLTSPARVERQVVGVSDPALAELVAGGLARLGHRRALVVHGEPGMDELSPLGRSHGKRVVEGEVEPFEVRPAEFGWSGLDAAELAGGTPAENAALTRAVLEGRRGGAARAAVVLNAGAALWAAGRAEELAGGVELAREAIDEGRAIGTLERLRSVSRALARRERDREREEAGRER